LLETVLAYFKSFTLTASVFGLGKISSIEFRKKNVKQNFYLDEARDALLLSLGQVALSKPINRKRMLPNMEEILSMSNPNTPTKGDRSKEDNTNDSGRQSFGSQIRRESTPAKDRTTGTPASSINGSGGSSSNTSKDACLSKRSGVILYIFLECVRHPSIGQHLQVRVVLSYNVLRLHVSF